MSIWQTMLDDFVELIEVDLLNGLHNDIHHTPSGLSVEQLPDTIMNGAFSVEFNGITQVNRDVNAWIWFSSDVKMRVAFVLNQEAKSDPNAATNDPVNNKEDYSNAVEDIYAIIKKRMDPTTYEGVLDSVDFVSCSNLVFILGTENYCYCDITFRVGVQETV
jgi:hypothetical protein